MGYLFLSPLFLLMGVFVFYSIYFLVVVSFHKWDGVDLSMMKYVGWRNYQQLFTDAVFLKALLHLLIWMVLTVGIQLFIGMVVAVLLRSQLPGHALFKALFYAPCAMASTIIAWTFNYLDLAQKTMGSKMIKMGTIP